MFRYLSTCLPSFNDMKRTVHIKKMSKGDKIKLIFMENATQPHLFLFCLFGVFRSFVSIFLCPYFSSFRSNISHSQHSRRFRASKHGIVPKHTLTNLVYKRNSRKNKSNGANHAKSLA
uniref:(northern house mosquito) hypothetical protein n=1 Tax=Culex pipiens TaxID=7175 RepID=A0A8D8ALB4_CULPI